MRVSLVILPSDRWREARRQWEWADDAGFATGWTYDHVRWGGMPDGPWHAAVPVLAAAAVVTARLRLGTLVATPNFRHPVTLAREAIALDDLSAGRLDLGLGPGSEGPDASVLGQDPWSPAERMARFEEFLEVLRRSSSGDGTDRTTVHTAYYARGRGAEHAGHRAGPAAAHHRRRREQRPAAGRADGQQWVTIGPAARAARTRGHPGGGARRQVGQLEDWCRQVGRPTPSKVLLWTPTETVLDSAEQFEELAGPYADLGFDEFVLHHPDQTGPYRGNISAFEEIAARARDLRSPPERAASRSPRRPRPPATRGLVEPWRVRPAPR